MEGYCREYQESFRVVALYKKKKKTLIKKYTKQNNYYKGTVFHIFKKFSALYGA